MEAGGDHGDVCLRDDVETDGARAVFDVARGGGSGSVEHPSSAVTLGDPGDHLGGRSRQRRPAFEVRGETRDGDARVHFRRRHVARWRRRGIAGCAVALVAGVLARLNGQVKSSSARERRASARACRRRAGPRHRLNGRVMRLRDVDVRARARAVASGCTHGARGGCAPRRGGHASHASNWRQGSSAAPIGIADSYPTDRDRSKGILPIRDLKLRRCPTGGAAGGDRLYQVTDSPRAIGSSTTERGHRAPN